MYWVVRIAIEIPLFLLMGFGASWVWQFVKERRFSRQLLSDQRALNSAIARRNFVNPFAERGEAFRPTDTDWSATMKSAISTAKMGYEPMLYVGLAICIIVGIVSFFVHPAFFIINLISFWFPALSKVNIRTQEDAIKFFDLLAETAFLWKKDNPDEYYSFLVDNPELAHLNSALDALNEPATA